MKEIKTSALPHKYENELHCNEVLLLPYYVASMNIEHEYMERTGEYKPFPGICLVDTFELAEPEQRGLSFMTEENTERVRRQKESPIFVIVGNPPYNIGQLNENDNNKNRKYITIDSRVNECYRKGSTAGLTVAVNDPYVKAIRWATDRIADEGVIAFVTNNSFIEQAAFDGMRKRLFHDFNKLYILDLGGNVRVNPKLSGTTHNVFGIQVGVSINLLVKTKTASSSHALRYTSVDEWWRREQKYQYLDSQQSVSTVDWQNVTPDARSNWRHTVAGDGFDEFLPIGDKSNKTESAEAVFRTFSNGLKTNRDWWVANYSEVSLGANIRRLVEFYNAQVHAWQTRADRRTIVDDFVKYDDHEISWSGDLKAALSRGEHCEFNSASVRIGQYRPFVRRYVYFDRLLNNSVYQLPTIFPADNSNNIAICVPGVGNRQHFGVFAVGYLPFLDFAFEKIQTLPFYTYDEDGTNRRENITDWALNEFRTQYCDATIAKWDIFHYVYAVLHHPEYRTRYAANLKRELPRIPFMAAAEGGPHLPPSGKCGADAAEETRNQDGFVSGRDFSRAETAAPFDEEAGRQPGGTPEGGGPGLQAGERCGAQSAPSNLPKASAQSARTERHKGIFWQFANAGKALTDLHVNYEQQKEFPLERIEKGQLNYRVERMRLSKDKTTLAYNDFLTLKGIPPETYGYRLGNRSALEWVIDQYQLSTDKRSGIVNDPNREEAPEYIVRLIGQVITVSLETMKIVKSLPEWVVDAPADSQAAEN